MNNKGADQTHGSVICAFVVAIWHKACFLMMWLIFRSVKQSKLWNTSVISKKWVTENFSKPESIYWVGHIGDLNDHKWTNSNYFAFASSPKGTKKWCVKKVVVSCHICSFHRSLTLFSGTTVHRQKVKLSTRSGWRSKYRLFGLING